MPAITSEGICRITSRFAFARVFDGFYNGASPISACGPLFHGRGDWFCGTAFSDYADLFGPSTTLFAPPQLSPAICDPIDVIW